MSRLKTLVRNENGVPPLAGGHALCQGCGVPLVVRTVLNTFTKPVVVVNATGCLEVATTRFPATAWNVPWLHVAFENAAAVASGVEKAPSARSAAGMPCPRRTRLQSSSSQATEAPMTSVSRPSRVLSSAATGSSSSATTTRRT